MILKKIHKLIPDRIFILSLLLYCCLLLSACSSGASKVPTVNLIQDEGASKVLTVAIYPYVPRLNQFKITIESTWSKVEPDVVLRFVDWDCYSTDPPETLEVFVFDAIFLSYFQEKGYLAAIKPEELKNADDFLEYALIRQYRGFVVLFRYYRHQCVGGEIQKTPPGIKISQLNGIL
jgi:thiamine pyridinylase